MGEMSFSYAELSEEPKTLLFLVLFHILIPFGILNPK